MTGRCYCGAQTISARAAPQIVTYCHYTDCRRVTGAPVAAFAAFDADDVRFDPPLGVPATPTPGVERWFCRECGSPVAARYDYLPGQVYVGLGLLDPAETLAPRLHAHAGNALPWLHIADDLPRAAGSSRDRLQTARET